MYSGDFGKIWPHSWDAFVIPTNVHGMWPRIVREGPGVERKVRALVKSQHEKMIAPSAFCKVLMLHFSLHVVKLANIDKTKVEKER